jgi:ferredoxin
MAITKVWIIEGCTSCGLCESICPEVFEMDDIAVVKQGVNFSENEDGIKDATDSCPAEVIKYE